MKKLKKADKYVLNQVIKEGIKICSWCDEPEVALQYLIEGLRKSKITKKGKRKEKTK